MCSRKTHKYQTEISQLLSVVTTSRRILRDEKYNGSKISERQNQNQNMYNSANSNNILPIHKSINQFFFFFVIKTQEES